MVIKENTSDIGNGTVKSIRKFSRSKKKNWRKFLSTKDVEAKAEEFLLENLTGGPVSKKADAELFVIDKGLHRGKYQESFLQASKANSAKQTRKDFRAICNSLYCERMLLPNPHVESIRGREKKKSKKFCYKKVAQRFLTGKQDESTFVGTPKDLWCEEVHNANLSSWANVNFENFVKPAQKAFATGKSKPPLAKLRRAVVPCHPGLSCNPSLADHGRALLTTASQIAFQNMNSIPLGHQFPLSLAKSFRTNVSASRRTFHKKFLMQSNSEKNLSLRKKSIFQVANKSNIQERKKTAQRNKEARQRALQRAARRKKFEKRRSHEFFRARKHVLEIEKKSELTQLAAKRRRMKKLFSELQPKRFGRLKYQPEHLDVQIGEELSGTLRAITPKSDFLRERFRSFQERNIIETRKRNRQRRKYKLKEYEKRSFKARADE
ncbi:ribosome biogenesis protein NOP53-like isoform X2 [Zophobas morio]|uniref:ribosome biogenesis protein NOP53-like isoform X2 n=1 Tax=Zophobas morio TaxID=2755281 RepID=UPI003083B901